MPMREEGDILPTKFFRVVRVPVEYVYVLASSEQGAIEQAKKGYGISVVTEGYEAVELPEMEWFKALDGVSDENGGHYNGDGTACFYNDETYEYYRLDPEKRMWLPIAEAWPSEFLDDDEAAEHTEWPMRFWEEDDFDPDETNGTDPWEEMFNE